MQKTKGLKKQKINSKIEEESDNGVEFLEALEKKIKDVRKEIKQVQESIETNNQEKEKTSNNHIENVNHKRLVKSCLIKLINASQSRDMMGDMSLRVKNQIDSNTEKILNDLKLEKEKLAEKNTKIQIFHHIPKIQNFGKSLFV